MTAKEWREKTRAAAAGEELALPSGMTIRARRPDPAQFVQWDMLPMTMARAVEVGPANLTDEEARRAMDLMRELLVWCCLDPRVSLDPRDESEIHPREIADADLWFIIGWAMRLQEAEKFRPFRRERQDLRAAGGGEAVLLQTVEPTGDGGPVPGAAVRPGGGEEGDGRGGR